MKITVTRFDPSQDAAPYDQTFEVPFTDKMTALEALMYIYENEEPIAFDGGRRAQAGVHHAFDRHGSRYRAA